MPSFRKPSAQAKHIIKQKNPKNRWRMAYLMPLAFQVYQKLCQKKLSASIDSDWWAVGFSFAFFMGCLTKFIQGSYPFSPMQQYRFKDECVRMWNYADRMIIRLFLNILKPTFKYIISKNCFHLQGPNGVKSAIRTIQNALNAERFHYALRLDIKSYYASIDHKILLDQLRQHFHDPRTLKYLEDIVTIAIDDGGNVFLPEKGLPRRSSLSSFFGALYLSPLDAAFEKRKGMIYARFMDDIVILCQTKRQYQKARKILFNILRKLKLVLSPHKTWMGAIKKGFHFLGINFPAANPDSQNQACATITIHPRSCTRALDKVNVLSSDAVYPAQIQRYLIRWAAWWANIKPLTLSYLLSAWCDHSRGRFPALAWFGTGLLSLFLPRGMLAG